jgi:probable addiction module antidote protein
MSIKTVRWDITEQLGSEEEIAAYLDAVFEVGDPDEIRDALGHAARARGMTDLAQSTGMSRSGLYKALGEDGNPSFETVAVLLKALGVRLSVAPLHKQLPA